MLKPTRELFTDPRLRACSLAARGMFCLLVAEVADDFGRLKWDSRTIAAKLNAPDDRYGLREVRRIMAEWVAHGLVRTWTVEGETFAECAFTRKGRAALLA